MPKTMLATVKLDLRQTGFNTVSIVSTQHYGILEKTECNRYGRDPP